MKRRHRASLTRRGSNNILVGVICVLGVIVVFQQYELSGTSIIRDAQRIRGLSRYNIDSDSVHVSDLRMPGPLEDKYYVILHNSASSLQWQSSMGFTGESLQHENIIEALRILNVSYYLIDYDLSDNSAFRAISRLAMEGKVERIDAIILSGAERASFFAEHSKEEPFWKPNQLLLLDDFGRTQNYLHSDIPLDHVLTWQPMKGNLFLGCFIDLSRYQHAQGNIRRVNDGLIWGKHDMPFHIKEMLIQVSKKYRLHCTSNEKNLFDGFDHANIEIHKKMPRHMYIEFMSSFKFMIGTGDVSGTRRIFFPHG